MLEATVLERRIHQFPHGIVGDTGDRDAACLARGLKSGRYVHAVAVNVITLGHDVAEVDADAKREAFVRRDVDIPFHHPFLNLDGALDRVDDGGEFQQQAIAHGLDDTAVEFRDQRVDQLGAMGPHRLEVSIVALAGALGPA